MKVVAKSVRQIELETMGVISMVSLFIGIVAESNAFLYTALFLQLIGLFVPPVSRLCTSLWLKLAEKIGWFNTRILLVLIYCLVLTPLAFLCRLLGKGSLKLKNRGKGSMYFERDHVYSKVDFFKQW